MLSEFEVWVEVDHLSPIDPFSVKTGMTDLTLSLWIYPWAYVY